MIGAYYDPMITPNELTARQRIKPFPPREELLKRNSFDNENRLANDKYLNAMIAGQLRESKGEMQS